MSEYIRQADGGSAEPSLPGLPSYDHRPVDPAPQLLAYRAVVERLIKPGYQLTDPEVLELTEAYYGGFRTTYTGAETGALYPPIAEGSWVAPIRATCLDIGEDAEPRQYLLGIPVVATAVEAVAVACYRGVWERFSAAAVQRKITAVDVLVSGRLAAGDPPRWYDVWLPPEKTPAYDEDTTGSRWRLTAQRYVFPKE